MFFSYQSFHFLNTGLWIAIILNIKSYAAGHCSPHLGSHHLGHWGKIVSLESAWATWWDVFLRQQRSKSHAFVLSLCWHACSEYPAMSSGAGVCVSRDSKKAMYFVYVGFIYYIKPSSNRFADIQSQFTTWGWKGYKEFSRKLNKYVQ